MTGSVSESAHEHYADSYEDGEGETYPSVLNSATVVDEIGIMYQAMDREKGNCKRLWLCSFFRLVIYLPMEFHCNRRTQPVIG